MKTGELVALPQPRGKRGKQKMRQEQQQQQQQQQATGQSQQHAAHAAPGEAAAAATGRQQPPPQQGPGAAAPAGDRMNPVCCTVCETEVGLRDPSEGVYHFFNVFASNS